MMTMFLNMKLKYHKQSNCIQRFILLNTTYIFVLFSMQSIFTFKAQPVQPPHLPDEVGLFVSILKILQLTNPTTIIPINITIMFCIIFYPNI